MNVKQRVNDGMIITITIMSIATQGIWKWIKMEVESYKGHNTSRSHLGNAEI